MASESAAAFFQRVYHTPEYAWRCCGILACLGLDKEGSAARAKWDEIGWPEPAAIVFDPSDEDWPAAIAFDLGDCIWAGIHGTDDRRQIAKYLNPINAYGAVHRGIINIPINAQFYRWGLKVANAILPEVQDVGTPVYLVGHSYGGAVATVAGVELSGRIDAGTIRITTFGAPKVGGRRYYDPLRLHSIMRYMNQRDPVPAMPPNQSELAFPLKIPVQLLSSAAWPAVVQAPGGILITDDATLTLANSTRLTPSMIDWIIKDHFSDDGFTNPERHVLKFYETQLRRVAQRQQYATPFARARMADTLPTDVATGNPFSQATIDYVDAYNRAHKYGNYRRQIPVPVPAATFRIPTWTGLEQWVLDQFILAQQGGISMPFVPSNFIAKKVKVGNQWNVQWMDQVIMEGTYSQCHSLCKVFNHFLRRMQVMSKVKQGTLEQQFALYFSEASAGGLGFKPDVLNVDPG